MAFFIILIDSLYLQESVVQRKKNWKKSSKNCENFHLKFWHRKILIRRFRFQPSRVATLVNGRLRLLKKTFIFLFFKYFLFLLSILRSIRGWKPTSPKRLNSLKVAQNPNKYDMKHFFYKKSKTPIH